MELLSDFPKIYCPFIRQTFKVNPEHFRQKRAEFNLRAPEVYLAISRINPGYEWVFDDPDTIAVEKLNGTNIKVKIENKRIVAVQNRMNVIDPLEVMGGRGHIMEGIFRAIDKGYIKENIEQHGELIGPKLQSNPYKLTYHLWYPFEKAISDLRYKSFHEHERTLDNWSDWFKGHLTSRFYIKKASKEGLRDSVLAEGIVFYNLKRKAENKIYMAKLRRDMFDWYYAGIEIYDYTKEGGEAIENQGKFE